MELVKEAEEQVDTISAADAIELVNDDNTVLIDLRESEELNKEGRIPGAVHVPRGMLEFIVDPKTRFHNKAFSSGKRIAFFCAGGLRSALAAQRVQAMGMRNVCHIGGGFKAWRKARGPIEKD